jgi:diguanylate cyclase (GGDEF)-like protein/PAS domain S-box-containing protein
MKMNLSVEHLIHAVGNHLLISVTDAKGIIVYANPKFCETCGFSENDLIGETHRVLHSGLQSADFYKQTWNTIANGDNWKGLLCNRNKDGDLYWVDTTITPIVNECGVIENFLSLQTNVTALTNGETGHSDTEAKDADCSTSFTEVVSDDKQEDNQYHLAEMVLAQTPEAVMITDTQLKIIKINTAFTKTTGYSEVEIIGQHPRILSSKRHGRAFYQGMWQSLDTYGQWQGEIWNRRKNGNVYPEWLNINSVKNDEGVITYYAGIFSDISHHHNVRQKLHDLAYYDALTGLPNRELFQNRLHEAIKLAQRTNKKLAVMFLDLDNFKNINDSLGHLAGDQLLRRVASALSDCIRSTDTVARFGGDEFMVMLVDLEQPRDIRNLADKILSAMEKPIELEDGNVLYISSSIGISVYPDDGLDAESLLKNADTAMYRAKDSGKKTFKFYTAEMSLHFNERLRIEHELRKAIDSGDLSVVYQPQVDAANGKILGFEALARWYHLEKGWVSPMVFIPIAEEAGLIVKIGDWILQEACEQLKKWQLSYSTELTMSVNLSGVQIRADNLVEKVLSVMNACAIKPGSLELELTETSLMANTDSTINTLAELSLKGVKIAIDDFGTGYSSLSYLKRFNIDKIKIDKAFINDITIDKNDAAIVKTIISMAHNMEMKIIAEGVETEEQLKFLIREGCHEVQGFYFCSPQSPSIISSILMSGGYIKPTNKPTAS